MKTYYDSWERIEAIVKHYGFASVSALARELGLNRSENLYQIKRGNNGISRELADTICRIFPEISKAWLLTGEGAMLPNRPNPEHIANQVIGIPYYDNFSYERPPEEPDKILYFSREFACDAEFATIYRDDALSPELKTGGLIFLKEWDVNREPIYGKAYCIVTENFSLFRIIRKVNERQILLTSLRHDKYDDLKIERKDIAQLYMVITN